MPIFAVPTASFIGEDRKFLSVVNFMKILGWFRVIIVMRTYKISVTKKYATKAESSENVTMTSLKRNGSLEFCSFWLIWENRGWNAGLSTHYDLRDWGFRDFLSPCRQGKNSALHWATADLLPVLSNLLFTDAIIATVLRTAWDIDGVAK